MQNDSTTPPNNRPVKLIALTIVTLLAFVFVAAWLLSYFSSGKLEIISSSNNLIEIKKADQTADVKQAQGKISISLKSGKYVVIVSNHVSATRQLITVKGHSSSHYQIDVQKLINSEPVLPYGAYGIFADNSQMLFADMQGHFLHKLLSSGAPSVIDGANTFGKVVWQNSNMGVGEDLAGGSLYTITGSSISNIRLPFTSQHLLFGLANDKLVVSDGNSVYVARGGSFNKIYSAAKGITSMSVGNTHILIGQESDTKANRDEQVFKILSLTGDATASLNTSSYSSSWSPDGKYLAITNDSSTTVYNAQFGIVGQLPDKNVLSLTWLNSNALLYGVGSNVFSYDITNQRSSQLSSLDGAGVSGIFPSTDGSQVYILEEVIGGASQTYRVSRINLAKNSPDYIYQLGLFLPVQLNQCSVDYVNFGRPTVMITPQSGSSAAACTQAAKTYLTQDGLDITKFDYVVRP